MTMQPDYAALLAFYEREGPPARRAKKKLKKERAVKRRVAKKRAAALIPPPEPRAAKTRRARRRPVEIGRRGWVTTRIALSMKDSGPQEVKAQVLGPKGVFAIHANTDQRGLYDLTHVPSGARLNSASAGARGLAKLKKLAQKLELAIDWEDPRIVRDHRRMLESGQDSRFMRELAGKVAEVRRRVLGR